MDQLTIPLPIYLRWGTRKITRFSLNLNEYRNAHFHILNKAKTLFEETVQQQLKPMLPMKRVTLTYRLFFGSNRAVDIANICCIVDKFFCDALVNAGKLPGDDKEIISEIHYQWGAIDKTNPRIEVTLSDIEWVQEDTNPMQISLSQTEIEEALLEYIEKQIALASDQSANVELVLEGKEIVAYVDITRGPQKPVESPETRAAPATRAKNKTPKAASAAKAPVAAAAEPEQEAEEENQEDETTAPFKEDIVMQTLAEEEATQAEPPAPIKAGIFSNATSSAAPSSPEAPAAPGPKSLFANLTKPTHVN